MVDLKQMQAAFLLQWLFQAQALDKWSHVPTNTFAPFGDKYLCFFLNLKSRAFKGLQMITSHFWNSVLKTWLDLNYHDPSSLCLCQLCYGTTATLSIKEMYSCLRIGLLGKYCM